MTALVALILIACACTHMFWRVAGFVILAALLFGFLTLCFTIMYLYPYTIFIGVPGLLWLAKTIEAA